MTVGAQLSIVSRKSGLAERELQKNDGAEQSAEWQVAEQECCRERGLKKGRLEGGAGLSPFMHRSYDSGGMLFSIAFTVSYFVCMAHWVHSSSHICCGALTACTH